ncbi:hypothetical protein FrEUN1fDRAFT_5019, partial [Parafrankia sp. EUN1f]
MSAAGQRARGHEFVPFLGETGGSGGARARGGARAHGGARAR